MIVEYFYKNGNYEAIECDSCVLDLNIRSFKTFGSNPRPPEEIKKTGTFADIKEIVVNGRIIYADYGD